MVGFLRPESARPQPYMAFLISLAGGCVPMALSQLIFVPIAQCVDGAAALALEQSLIDSEHPMALYPVGSVATVLSKN